MRTIYAEYNINHDTAAGLSFSAVVIMPFITTLLPLPVAPAISKWGCCSISA